MLWLFTPLDPSVSCLPFPLGELEAFESAADVSIRFPVYKPTSVSFETWGLRGNNEEEERGLCTNLAFNVLLARFGIRLSVERLVSLRYFMRLQIQDRMQRIEFISQ